MFSIKKQFSHNVNRVMGYNQFYNNHDTCSPRRRASACAPSGDRGHHQNQIIDDFEKKITHFRDAFAQKHPGACPHPRFAWQKSFYDHIIRNETDFYNHVKYISRQNEKHVTNGMVWLGDVWKCMRRRASAPPRAESIETTALRYAALLSDQLLAVVECSEQSEECIETTA